MREAVCADAAAIARVQVDTWRATYAGIVPDTLLAELSYTEDEASWSEDLGGGGARDRDAVADDSFALVAEAEGGAVVAFASGGRERSGGQAPFTGELYAIYVRPEWQGHGLGRQLVAEVAGRLAHRGHTSMLVVVLADNRRACRFYESLGAVLVGEREDEIGGEMLRESVYGWRELATLLPAVRVEGDFAK